MRPFWIRLVSAYPRATFVVALAAAFLFRLFYGLSMPFWFEDERQVYLIGLRSFARGEWPYFGADVVWTGGQLPGALLGWLIRLPLSIAPIPESPVILLNLLSFAALSFLAWYLGRRLPDVPRWLIWTTLLTLPWTLNFSTHVINPSFAVVGAIVFFVGFFEALPPLRRGIVPLSVAWFHMGFGFVWVLQLHLSYVLLAPYVLVAAVWTATRGVDGLTPASAILRAGASFAGGSALPAALLVPTLLRYGLDAGHTREAVVFHLQSPVELLTTTARVLSFASFEVNRFLGMSTAERVLAVLRQPHVAVTVLPVLVAGILHPLWMAVSAVRPRPGGSGDWLGVRALTAATIALIFASYFFSIRGPQAHSFYVVFPVAALFAFTCWDARVRGRSRGFERLAAVVLVCNVLMHLGLAWDRLSRQSLYVDRDLVAAAIADRNDRYLGDRRDTQLAPADHDPRPVDRLVDPVAFRSARATDDLELLTVQWVPRLGRFSAFDGVLANRGQAAAWLDVRLVATYWDEAGDTLETREVVVKEILQPGATRSLIDLADGSLPAGATGATLAVVGAEKVIPR